MYYFDDVVGQNHIKENFKKLLDNNSLPHSLLFYGEAGLGQLEMALALASSLLQRRVFNWNDITYEPVIIDGTQAFLLRAEKATIGLKISQWHTLLHDYLNKATDDTRVIIIENFETARNDFMNAILKSIEEPPDKTFFIIITTKKNRVLPTILSRCMLVPFISVDKEEIIKGLIKKGFNNNIEEAAALSQGNFAKAVEILSEEDNVLLDTLQLFNNMFDLNSFFTKSNIIFQNYDKENVLKMLSNFRIILRDIEAVRHAADDSSLILLRFKNKMVKLLAIINSQMVNELLKESLKAEDALALNIKPSLVINGILIKMMHSIRSK